MLGYFIIACWFLGLGTPFYLETKRGGVEAAGRVSILVVGVTALAAFWLADWVVIPVAVFALALWFGPKAPDSEKDDRAEWERAELQAECVSRREELRQAKEDCELGLISEREYDELVAQITAPLR